MAGTLKWREVFVLELILQFLLFQRWMKHNKIWLVKALCGRLVFLWFHKQSQSEETSAWSFFLIHLWNDYVKIRPLYISQYFMNKAVGAYSWHFVSRRKVTCNQENLFALIRFCDSCDKDGTLLPSMHFTNKWCWSHIQHLALSYLGSIYRW